MWLVLTAMFLGTGAIPTGGFAQEAEAIPSESLPEGWYLLFLAVKVILVLGFILILILITIALMKKIMEGRLGGQFHNSAIRVLGITYIAPKKAIGLVRVLNRVYIIGMSESSMDAIGEIPLEEVQERFPDYAGDETVSNWRTLAKKWVSGRNTEK